VLAATAEGTTTLWLRSLDSGQAVSLKGTDGAQLPAWDATGTIVSFFAGGRLRQTALDTGVVTDLAAAPLPAGAAWLPDGSVLFAPEPSGAIRRLSRGGLSDATVLRPGDRGHVFPAADETTGLFVYTAVSVNGRRQVRLVRSGEEHDLAATSGHAQLVNGHLLYLRDDVLVAQRLDKRTLTLEGRPTRLATGVGVSPEGRGLFVASSRLLLSAPLTPRPRRIAWFDMNGHRTSTVGDAGAFWQIRLSPDDRYAAVTVTAPLLRTLDIFIVPADGGGDIVPLTRALTADSDPVWAPDGERVAYRSLQTGRPTILIKAVQDSQAEIRLEGSLDSTPSDWRGSAILAHVIDEASGSDVVALNGRDGTLQTIVRSGFNDTDGRWSPDGRWVAHVVDESGQPDIYVSRPSDGPRVRASFGGGTKPRWSRDGRAVFFMRGNVVMRAEFQDAVPPRFGSPVPVLESAGLRDFDIAHRREAIVAIVGDEPNVASTVSALIDWPSMMPPVP
jgi:hypothetical protein